MAASMSQVAAFSSGPAAPPSSLVPLLAPPSIGMGEYRSCARRLRLPWGPTPAADEEAAMAMACAYLDGDRSSRPPDMLKGTSNRFRINIRSAFYLCEPELPHKVVSAVREQMNKLN